MDSLRNSFEINLTIREAKSSGNIPTTIHAEIGGQRVNISSTVPIVAEIYVESNSKGYELNNNLVSEPNSYKKVCHTENGSARNKRSIDYPQSSFTESPSTREKRSLNFKEKSDYKMSPMQMVTVLPSLPGSSSENENPKENGGYTYPYNYEKEYKKLKAKELKFEREQKKKEERQVKNYYKQHEKMIEGWQKLNDKQNSLWEKERDKERARKEELRKQREENEKKLHAEYLRSLEKKKSQMQSKSGQDEKFKKRQ